MVTHTDHQKGQANKRPSLYVSWYSSPMVTCSQLKKGYRFSRGSRWGQSDEPSVLYMGPYRGVLSVIAHFDYDNTWLWNGLDQSGFACTCSIGNMHLKYPRWSYPHAVQSKYESKWHEYIIGLEGGTKHCTGSGYTKQQPHRCLTSRGRSSDGCAVEGWRTQTWPRNN